MSVLPYATILDTMLTRLPAGELLVRQPDGHDRLYTGALPGTRAEVVVREPDAAKRILLGGSIGLAEGYMSQEWDTPDLDAVLELGLDNTTRIESNALPTPLKPLQRSWHALRGNSRQGSRRNVAYHYDLGNEFYRLWLDPDMTYSSAMFDSSEGQVHNEDLPSAQKRKWNALLDILQPGRRDHLLEIGCGWGGFAIHAAKEAGCRVTGVTLSREQYDWANRRVAEEDLGGQIDVRLQDYRDVTGAYSGIVSVEMFEAVGERWWPVFFSRLHDLLGRGGRAAVQTITIAEERFGHYRANPDFIQRYIFPGGMLPSPSKFTEAAAAQGLTVGDPVYFGASYAQTLERWRDSFEAALPHVRALGFDERFVRMWRYYLAYCRTGFNAGSCDVMQIALER